MKFFAVTLISLLMAACAGAQLLNAGFESWTGGNPDNWVTPNAEGNIYVSPSEERQEGNFAALLTTSPEQTTCYIVQYIDNVTVGDRVEVTLFAANLSAEAEAQAVCTGWQDGRGVDGGGDVFTTPEAGFNQVTAV